MAGRTVPLDGPFDLLATLQPLVRGRGDRTIRVAPGEAAIALRTRFGPVTVMIAQTPGSLRFEAWGDGAEALLERAPSLVGLGHPRPSMAGPYDLIIELARRHPGVRLTSTGAVLASLVPAILEQKVAGTEARRAWQGLVRRYGEAAPGPPGIDLRLPPSAGSIVSIPYFDFHPLGVERRRAELVRRVATRADWFEASVDLPFDQARARLMSLPGLGPWTAAEVSVRAMGDPDAVSVGDYHLKNLVSWTLAGEPRGTDERMLELLEPYAGRRAHVVRLLELSGLRPPRYGPRCSPRRIEST